MSTLLADVRSALQTAAQAYAGTPGAAEVTELARRLDEHVDVPPDHRAARDQRERRSRSAELADARPRQAVAALDRLEDDALPDLPDVVDPALRGGVHLDHVQ